MLPTPQWLKECKSEVADLDGWQHWLVRRYYPIMRKDKFYRHRDYSHTFRSKADVKHFLDTGEARGKGLLQKGLICVINFFHHLQISIFIT
ncbi:hypothetical protein HU200_060082 [Digitaria exilis]|uniref:Uncharacterized protein n=1 Tax=Digitaria exilis TaxID=1010633 RepID=A0A835ABH8_9POAL|nr:hypothetical protein HU200_060082 [Digitaria exilis]